MSVSTAGTVFIWEGMRTLDGWAYFNDYCPYCSTRLVKVSADKDGWGRVSHFRGCPLCGWTTVELEEGPEMADEVGPPLVAVATLKEYDLSSTELGIAELGTHLKKNFSDIYSLDPGRFEVLVGDIFSDHDLEPVVTRPTRDGGVDVFLIGRNSGVVEAIIECKRYAEHRSVGIQAVQRLAGVAIEWGVGKAYLVTTSKMSRPVLDSACRINTGMSVELELVTANEIFSLLGVYNERLPRLDKLDADKQKEIILSNSMDLTCRIPPWGRPLS